VRLEQLRLDHMAGNLRQPLRLDRGDAAPVKPSRIDQFGGHDPAAGFLRQIDARMAIKANATRTEVPLVVVALDADVAEQPGQQRQVELVVGGRRCIEPPALLGHHGE
jgi:hypothetical protein